MSFENIKNSQNKTITWESFRNELKANKADSETIDKMRSIFYEIDANKDMRLSQEELNNAYALLNSMDNDKNGKISNDELKASGNSQKFGTKKAEDINQFMTSLQTISNGSKDNTESVSQETAPQPETQQTQASDTASETNGIEKKENLSETKQEQKSSDAKQQALTEYTVQPGDTPEKIAKKFGLTGDDAKEFIDHLKKQTNQKGWFIVGQKITLLGDHTEALKNMSDYTEDKTELSNRWANTDAGKKAIAAEQAKKSGARASTTEAASAGGNQKSSVSEGNLPKSIQDRIASLKQSGDSYEITGDAQTGYTIKVTSGKYMNQHKIGLIEMKYDSAGNLQTYTQKYNNGQINETTYAGGKKTRVIAQPAPEKFQKIAANMQKESGGNARIEYNKETGHYEIIQTNINYKDVKEIRTVLSDKAWQENLSTGEAAKEGIKDAWDTFRLVDPNSWKKAVNAGLKNREDRISDSDYILTQTTTYNDGKVIKGTYTEGKLKTNEILQASKAAKPEKAEEKEQEKRKRICKLTHK